MKPRDSGTERVTAGNVKKPKTTVYNYRSSFDWLGVVKNMTGGKALPADYQGRTGPDNVGEQRLFHCAAFGLPCTATLHPTR